MTEKEGKKETEEAVDAQESLSQGHPDNHSLLLLTWRGAPAGQGFGAQLGRRPRPSKHVNGALTGGAQVVGRGPAE